VACRGDGFNRESSGVRVRTGVAAEAIDAQAAAAGHTGADTCGGAAR